ncbi:MAG: hypothetical protein R2852_00235 [Bacteroidia bacterium]
MSLNLKMLGKRFILGNVQASWLPTPNWTGGVYKPQSTGKMMLDISPPEGFFKKDYYCGQPLKER